MMLMLELTVSVISSHSDGTTEEAAPHSTASSLLDAAILSSVQLMVLVGGDLVRKHCSRRAVVSLGHIRLLLSDDLHW